MDRNLISSILASLMISNFAQDPKASTKSSWIQTRVSDFVHCCTNMLELMWTIFSYVKKMRRKASYFILKHCCLTNAL